jgi:hypothetical protein
MIAFQFTRRENPSKFFRRDGSEMAIDLHCEVVILPGDTEVEDIFKVH